MIESVHIQGFQSHKDSTLEFAPGVNAITGPSANGKTAILRAIEWVRTNRPLSDRYINNSMKFASVDVSLSDPDCKTTRTRYRTGRNAYIYAKRFGMPEEFSAMGADVPEPVTTAFDFADLNVQSQFDSYFLLYESGGSKAQYINGILHIDEGDALLKWLNSERRRVDSEAKACQERVEQLNASLVKFTYLDKFAKRLEEYEQHEKTRDEAAERQTKVAAIRDDAADVCDRLAALPDYDALLVALAKLEKAVETKTKTAAKMSERADSIGQLTKSIKRTKARLDSINIPAGFEGLARACENIIERRRARNARLKSINRNLDEMDECADAIEATSTRLTKRTQALAAAEKELTHCDRCGQKLTPDARIHLLGE